MAKPISVPSKRAQLAIAGVKGLYKVPRVQRLSLNADNPVNIVDEIGNRSHAGQTKDVPNVTLSFTKNDEGSIKLWAALTGTDAASYPASGVDVSQLKEFDAVLYTKSDVVDDYAKSVSSRRMRIQSIALNYGVDSEATEDYTAVGTKRRVTSNDVIIDTFVTGTTSFTLSQTPIQLKNGEYAISAILDGVYLTEVSTVPSTGEYRISGTTLTTGDARTSQLVVTYLASPTGENWSDINEPSFPAAVMGKDIPIQISANSIPRVQSVTINANLNPRAVIEMGNADKIVGYQVDVPQVEGTITVLDTDTELVALFTNGTISGTEWSMGEGCYTATLSLEVKVLDPCTRDVLKTVYLDSIEPVGDAYSVNVNGDAQLAINFRSVTGHLVIYSGERA